MLSCKKYIKFVNINKLKINLKKYDYNIICKESIEI